MSPRIAALLLASLSPLAMVPNIVTAAPAIAPAAQLKQLFLDSDEAYLKRNPIQALYRGDMRYADRIGDNVSDAYYQGELKAAKSDLKRLKAVKRAALGVTDQIAYDVFKWQTELNIKGLSAPILPLTIVRPMDHFSGWQSFYPDIASGQGAAPYQTVADYDNGLKRHRDYIALLDQTIVQFRKGLKSGVVQPKLVVNNVIEQLDLQIAQGVTGSTFYVPVKQFPAGVPEADRTRLRAGYTAIIRDGINPAYVRLRNFLKTDYLPRARDGVGLVSMKGGKQLYDYLIQSNTTLPLSADTVHTLGLSEVARITKEMETIRKQTRYKGTLAQFFVYLRNDPKFKLTSKEALRDGYYSIGRRVDARVREQFSTIPKSPLEIRPVPDYREKTDAGGSYNQGTPDGSRPGIFYFNSYDLPSRTTPGMETLFLHEAVPGHHFQVSLAQENEALPSFMRFGGNTAYVEGWALYAETLWKPLGMETDPYQRFGGLNDEMLRAMRLVVDTGIHAKGWSRDKAIKYMLDNSSMSETDARAEVERYIAIPGQALAYKIGQLTILRLKDKAMKAFGRRFDPKAFHAQVLMTGALPMGVLEQKIDAWIKASK